MDRREFMTRSIAGASATYLASARAPLGGAKEATARPNSLADHRIAKIESWKSNDRYSRSLGPNATSGPKGRGYGRQFRTVTTDHGAVGFGMSWAPDDQVAAFQGARISDLFDPAVGTDREADALDLVLHDLAGVILGKPVYQLLGAKGPTEIPIYSGSIYMDDLLPENAARGSQAVVDSCRQDHEAGYRAFKLKIGRGAKWMPREEGRARDIEVTRAVREAFPDSKILVDANDSYSCEEFLGYVSAVADCDLFWIEEPFYENREELKRLRDHMERVGCSAYLADGEARKDAAETVWRYGGYSENFIDTLFALAEEDLIDVLVLDLGIVGFTRWRHIMPELEEAGLLAAPHLWGGTPRPFYCAHLAAGVGNTLIVEGIPGTGTHLDYSAFVIEDGNLIVPEKPGFAIGYTK